MTEEDEAGSELEGWGEIKCVCGEDPCVCAEE